MIGDRLRRAFGRRRRPPRALLAWEYGSGHTHGANILGVARHLRAAGFTCLATLHDTRAGRGLAALGVPAVQNGLWPHARRWVPHDRERAHAGFVDVLGNLGFGDGEAVAAILSHYDGLFALFEPDIVLAENAYGAHLAARGRMPALAFGFGQYLPPVVGGRLGGPEDGPASWADAEVLAGIEDGLARTGRAPIGRLAEIFALEAILPFGPAAFDRYARLRTVPALPAHVPGFRPGLRAGAGEEVFVYLQGFAVRMPAVMTALAALPRPVRAHIPDLDPDDRERLLGAGAILADEPLPIGQIIARARCVLHHGGVGLAALCLSAGLPQAILSKQLDNRTAGAFVAAEGLGWHGRLVDATAEAIVAATLRARDDAALRARCRARAPAFDAWFGPDPTRRVAAEACRLLGHPPPP